MSMQRKSFWKATVLAAAAGVGALLVGALVAWLLPGPAGLVARPLAIIVWIIGLTALLVACGGLVVLRRDALQTGGGIDLFIRLNRSRCEPEVLRGPVRGARWLRWGGGKSWQPQVGEVVEVKSFAEIAATLDASGCLDGLPFMAEMARFCGQRVRVFRGVDKVYDYGRTKLMRRMDDAVALTSLRCQGALHGGCQAACYLIWKTAWLRPVPRAQEGVNSAAPTGAAAVADATAKLPASVRSDPKDGAPIYKCQYTELAAASTPLSQADFRQDLRPLLAGNVSFLAFCMSLLTRLFNRVQAIRGGAAFPYKPPSASEKTPLVTLGLQPGERVRVLSAQEIALTLNARGKNRGLWFDADMLKHTGQKFTVMCRVERLIADLTGRMLEMKAPCVVLEGVYSTGEYLRFSAQHDFLYWREAWLAREPTQQ
jgi:hypothetical protein